MATRSFLYALACTAGLANAAADTKHTLTLDFYARGEFTAFVGGVTLSQTLAGFPVNVYGDGPFVVAAKVKRGATFITSVGIDGVYYSQSGVSDSKWMISDYEPRPGWNTELNYVRNYELFGKWRSDLIPSCDGRTYGFPLGCVNMPQSSPYVYYRIEVLPQAAHELKVVLNVDDWYKLSVNGRIYDEVNSYTSVRQYTQPVYGDGPFFVAIQAENRGGPAGVIAAVFLDGQLVSGSETGTEGNKWLISEQEPGASFFDYPFAENDWISGYVPECKQNSWPDQINEFRRTTNNARSVHTWIGRCEAIQKFSKNWFGLSFTAPNKKRVLKTFLNADDQYEATINGRIYSTWGSSATWNTVQAYTQVVEGDGPWVVGVKAMDLNKFGAFIAALFLDDLPVQGSQTGAPGHKWIVTDSTPSPDYANSISYQPANDVRWISNLTSNGCEERTNEFRTNWVNLLNIGDYRSVWYPSCNAGAISTIPRINYFRLLVTPPAEHRIKLVIAVDDQFDLNLAGGAPYRGVGNWEAKKKYEKTVFGDGPFLISVLATNVGGASAFAASVYVDGLLYTDTGVSGSKWRVPTGESSSVLGLWFTYVDYSEEDWTVPSTQNCLNPWGKISGGSQAKSVWGKDGCSSPYFWGTGYANFRLKVVV